MDTHHFVILKILKNRELSEVYAMMSLRAIAMSLISVFVPIYLYTLGYGIPTIILFFITISVTHIIFCPISAKISSKMGFKHSMLLSHAGYFIYFVLLAMLPTSRLLYPIAVFFGMSQALFWVPFHAFFSTLTDKNSGEEIALLDMFPTALSIAAPFVGGLIVFFAGFGTLFVAGLTLMMAAALPLFVSRDTRMPFRFSLNVQGFDKRVAGSLISYSDQLNVTIWPLFIFAVAGSAAVLGGVVAFGALMGFAAAWIVGRMCDRGYRRRLLRLGSGGQFIVWMFRAAATSIAHIISLESIWGVVSRIRDIPYSCAYYNKARRTRRKLEFSVLREMSIHASIAAVFTAVYLVYIYIPSPSIVFLIASVGALATILIEK